MVLVLISIVLALMYIVIEIIASIRVRAVDFPTVAWRISWAM